jgi:acyl dehydratase
MPVKTEAIGKTYPSMTYEVGLEKIREYANAVGADNPVHRDRDAAKAAGFRDVVAPPMFAVVFQFPAMFQPATDPDVGMNLAMLVHGGQDFTWEEPICVGDQITTEIAVKEIYEKDGKGFYVFDAVSKNQDGADVVTGVWTNIIRGV